MPAQRAFLTGYEKENVDEFIQKITLVGTTVVVDVREYPFSRKRGFSKNAFRSRLEDFGIKYIHVRELGSPKSMRHALNEGSISYMEFFRKYRIYVKGRHLDLRRLVDLADEETICIMCFERECDLCHRAIIADEISKLRPSLKFLPI